MTKKKKLYETTKKMFENIDHQHKYELKLNNNATFLCLAHIWMRKWIHIKQIKNEERRKTYQVFLENDSLQVCFFKPFVYRVSAVFFVKME